MQRQVSAGRARHVLLILTLIGVCNWMDRGIVSILLEPIKAEFHVSDSLMGLLTGFGFSLLYAVASIPVARYADLHSRRNVIAVGVALWSVMTLFCGVAQSFAQLLLARMGVGAAESAGSAPSQSMISDFFPSERRPFAMGIHSSSVYIGNMVSALIGGWIGFRFGWRVALVAASIPGLILALVLFLTIEEPARGRLDQAPVRPLRLKEAATVLAADRVYVCIVLGLSSLAVVNGATLAWTPALLGRVHHLNLAELGVALAAVGGSTGVIGTVLGGVIASRIAKGNVRTTLLICAAAGLLAIPSLLTLTLGEGLPAVFFGIGCYQIFMGMPIGISLAAVQDLVPITTRALAAATVTLCVALIGIGGGPLIVGVLNDVLNESFAHHAVRYGLVMTAPFLVIGSMAYCLGARHLVTSRRQES
jgi:MFS family permease